MSTNKIPVNPALLRWARERAGLSLEEAAMKAKLRQDRQGTTPEDRLIAFESGKDAPSLSQAEQLAHVYRRPLVTFFLPHPPQETTKLVDFRTVADRTTQKTPEFSAFLRRIISMHNTLKEIDKADPQPEKNYVGCITTKTKIKESVDIIYKILNTDENSLTRQRSASDAFSLLRERAHMAGIYVVLLGDLGSHHSAIPPSAFRGISISDTETPLIVINTNDSQKARIFSLLHELTHILLGENGISNISSINKFDEFQENEVYCNKVAANYLVPNNLLLEQINNFDDVVNLELLEKLSCHFKASRFTILRKMKELNMVEDDEYWGIWSALEHQQHVREKRTGGGPSRNVLDSFHLGKKLLVRIVGAAEEGIISYTEASTTLGVPPSRFERVLSS